MIASFILSAHSILTVVDIEYPLRVILSAEFDFE